MKLKEKYLKYFYLNISIFFFYRVVGIFFFIKLMDFVEIFKFLWLWLIYNKKGLCLVNFFDLFFNLLDVVDIFYLWVFFN